MEVNVAYIKYLTARLSSFSNVWWSLANEYDYVKAKTEADWETLIQTVVVSDPYGHLCSIHGSTATYFPYWMEELTHTSIQDEAPVEDFGRASIVRSIHAACIPLIALSVRDICTRYQSLPNTMKHFRPAQTSPTGSQVAFITYFIKRRKKAGLKHVKSNTGFPSECPLTKNG
jgi:hypothetical protein